MYLFITYMDTLYTWIHYIHGYITYMDVYVFVYYLSSPTGCKLPGG